MLGMQKKRPVAGFLVTARELITLLLIVFLIRTFVFGLYQVPTGSMETTMLVGERFFADKFTILFSKPKRGEIVSFNDPRYPYSSNPVIRLFQEYVGTWSGPINWTKRVIGVPGDVIKGVVENGEPVIYINDEKLDQPFVNKYPLLARYLEDPTVLREQALRQAFAAMHNYGLSHIEKAVEQVADELMLHHLDWRSYDPHAPYDKQPFYRFSADRVAHAIAGGVIAEGVTVTPDGRLMLEPNKPNQIIGMDPKQPIRQGKSSWNGSDDFYIELGTNEYWLMGDNRRGSYDCRAFGPINGRLIHGKIVFRIWSLDSTSNSWLDSWWIIDLIKHPIDFWTRVRWNRFFQVMH